MLIDSRVLKDILNCDMFCSYPRYDKMPVESFRSGTVRYRIRKAKGLLRMVETVMYE
jgi:hypothetical protein